jgi:sigma-E factor negative regulatory protein RseB
MRAPILTSTDDPHPRLGVAIAACILVGLLFASTRVLAQSSDVQAMLKAMTEAVRTLDYQGSLVYQHEGRVDTLRVFHAGGALERERLISLNGPRREVVRSGTMVTCIEPDGSATVYSSGKGQGLLPLVPIAGDAALDEYYQVQLVSTDRVAGCDADVLEVMPRDAFRYGYRLWLDRGTRLLLRSTVIDEQRRTLEQFMFVALEIGKLPSDTDLIPRQSPLPASKAAPVDEMEMRSPPRWQVRASPPGYRFVSGRQSRQGQGSEHLLYSDGLANVSIYLEPRDAAESASASLARRGTLHVFSLIQGDWRITVLGNVPAATVTAIGQSLYRADAAKGGHG